jgi:LuxR family maltose regulon positive regulatory protein
VDQADAGRPSDAAGAAAPAWLPTTKLAPPTLRPDIVSRPRLREAVRAALEQHRLVLVSAPAGSGKTTLMAEAVQAAGLRPAWVALDAEDNDPARFLAVLVAAARRLDAHCGDTAGRLLAATPNPAPRAREIIGALINDLAAISVGPTILVLDDLHLLTEPAVLGALDYLLERSPPQLHLLVATRHDPPLALARLRARGELAEIHFPDLRFNTDEVTKFLDGRGLSPAELSLLHERTGGWAAGLRLMAGALAHLPNVHERSALLAGLDRADRQMFAFLAEEVLRHESPEMQTFLQQTAILSRLTSSLCRAVTGRSDAGLLLDDLERRNLFVVALDDPGEQTFRYHDLFAAFLRERLERTRPEAVPELHRRAAQAHPVATDAIGHLLHARLWAEAAERIEPVGEALLRHGLLGTVSGWLAALPASMVGTRGCLLYLQGLCAWHRGAIAEARAILERVRDLPAVGTAATRGKATAHLATIALMQGDGDRAATRIEQALALPTSAPARVQLLLERGRVRLWRGERSGAAADLDTVLAICRQAPERDVVAALITYLHPIFGALPGGLDRVEQICQLAIQQLADEADPLQLVLAEQWALVHLRRGRFAACVAAAERALADRQRYGSINPLMDRWAAWSLATVHSARARYREAEPHFDLLFQLAGPGEAQRAPALYSWGWACWLQGRHAETRDAYRELCTLDQTIPSTPILRTMLEGLLLTAEGQHGAAEQRLRQAIVLERGLAVGLDLHGNPRLLLAHLHLVTGRVREVLDELAPVLDACEREDAPGLIAREGPPMVPLLRLAVERGAKPGFAARVLEILGVSQAGKPLRVPETGEILSAREVEILRLLAQGASNRAMADQLVVSQTTVKTHVSHILRKLDVASRTQAAARARELQLV